MVDRLKLEDVCAELVDCVNRTAPESENGDYFAVGTPAMRGNVIDFSQVRRISTDTFETWTRRLVPEDGDLLLAREAPVGPVVRVPPGGRIAAGQRTMHLRADPAIVRERFLYYLLISPMVQADLMTRAMGSTVPHLRVADVKAFELPALPPVKDQQAIADVLGALDDKIAANDRVHRQSKELLAARFERLRIDLDPEGEVSSIGIDELVELNPRVAAPAGSKPVYLGMKNLPNRDMTVRTWDRREARGGVRFVNGDTLLARITPCLENGKTGYVDFMRDGEVGLGSTEYIVMRSRRGVPPVLPYFLAISPRFREFAIRHLVGSSGRQRLAAPDLAGLRVQRPDSRELELFGALAENLHAVVKAAMESSRRLAATRDEMLPLLMSGKVRVKDAEKAVEDVV